MPAFSPARNSEEPVVRMFATCIPGLAPILAKQLSTFDNTKVVWHGNDGRADLVSFTVGSAMASRVAQLTRIADDLFLQIGHARRSDGDRAGWLAQRLCRNDQLAAATTRAGRTVTSLTFRVVVRVLSERSFPRTDLRRHAEAAIMRLRPSWHHHDPASNEVWISEYRPGLFVAGLRVTDRDYRQRGGRQVERDGALRPGMAAALVSLAGEPEGLLVDPCCGSGTVLAEASAIGWQVLGFDIDADAVVAAKANVPGATATTGDARRLDLADGAAAAWVSNVPFGHRHRLPADSAAWFRAVLGEAARVVRLGGRVVVLSAGLPERSAAALLRPHDSCRVRVLGRAAVIDVFIRA